MNEIKTHIKEAGIVFSGTFFSVLALQIDTLDASSITGSLILGIVITSVISGLKAIEVKYFNK